MIGSFSLKIKNNNYYYQLVCLLIFIHIHNIINPHAPPDYETNLYMCMSMSNWSEQLHVLHIDLAVVHVHGMHVHGQSSLVLCYNILHNMPILVDISGCILFWLYIHVAILLIEEIGSKNNSESSSFEIPLAFSVGILLQCKTALL